MDTKRAPDGANKCSQGTGHQDQHTIGGMRISGHNSISQQQQQQQHQNPDSKISKQELSKLQNKIVEVKI